MSTRVRRSSAAKNTSSWVRPGVCDVLARPLRLASALMRLDLPTLERPTKAISSPRMTGSEAVELAAEMKRHSGANSLRPAPISLAVKVSAGIRPVSGLTAHARLTFFFEEGFDTAPDVHEEVFEAACCILQVVKQLDLGAMAAHDDRLLDDRQRIVPGPVDHQAG